MNSFCCPKCKSAMTDNGKSLVCENGHCFDKAKSGYVNLLMSNQSSDKRHGDDKIMVNARTDFLSSGCYDPLIEKAADLCRKYTKDGGLIIDSGCGEGTYTAKIAENTNARVCGIDISKEAVNRAAKNHKNIDFCVASCFDMPIPDKTADTVVNIFAPDANSEFLRVLKSGGILICALPDTEHLFELKKAVYDSPVKNPPPVLLRDGFELIEKCSISFDFTVDNIRLNNLFMMTPYYYKTSADDQKKLNKITNLEITAQFLITVYKKI